MDQASANERAERRGLLAVLVVFALLVQALIPTLASAAPSYDHGQLICTDAGLAQAPVELPAGRKPAHTCDHCLGAAMAVQPSVVLTISPAEFEAPREGFARAADAPPPNARGPPRPPGQGPPSFDA